MVDHGVKLELMAGTCLVGGHGPGNGIEGEIVEFLSVRRSQGNDEVASLPGVVDQRRRNHLWTRHSRGLALGGGADDRLSLGQSDHIVFSDDGFNLLEALLIERQNGLGSQLLGFQSFHHVTIVAARQMTLQGNFRSF